MTDYICKKCGVRLKEEDRICDGCKKESNKTVWDLHQEALDKYGTRENTYEMFPVGTKVKIITPCQDFCFFYGETGKVIRNHMRYMGIIVEFDKPRMFVDGKQVDFNFEPSDLIILQPIWEDDWM